MFACGSQLRNQMPQPNIAFERDAPKAARPSTLLQGLLAALNDDVAKETSHHHWLRESQQHAIRKHPNH